MNQFEIFLRFFNKLTSFERFFVKRSASKLVHQWWLFYRNELATWVVSKKKTYFFCNWCHFIARAIVPHHKHNRRSKKKIFMLLFPLKRFMVFFPFLPRTRNCRSERSSKKLNIVLCTLTHNFLLPYSFARLDEKKSVAHCIWWKLMFRRLMIAKWKCRTERKTAEHRTRL